MDFHIFYKKEVKWFCDTCLGKCSKSATMKKILPENNFNELTADQKEIQYPVVSNISIPVSFDESMSNLYEEQQLCSNLNLPIELLPEKELCEYNYKFSKEKISLERRGLILYTAKTVVELAEHKGRL